MTRLTTLASVLAIGGLISVAIPTETPVLASAAPVGVQVQAQQEHHPTAAEQAEMQKQESQMMQMHQKMMADMKAMDDRLNTLASAMTAATGQAKVDAMAELVTVMVQQRTMMRDGMMRMQGQMMGHMMQHMAMGTSPEAHEMMAACPMMKMMMSGGGGQ